MSDEHAHILCVRMAGLRVGWQTGVACSHGTVHLRVFGRRELIEQATDALLDDLHAETGCRCPLAEITFEGGDA